MTFISLSKQMNQHNRVLGHEIFHREFPFDRDAFMKQQEEDCLNETVDIEASDKIKEQEAEFKQLEQISKQRISDLERQVEMLKSADSGGKPRRMSTSLESPRVSALEKRIVELDSQAWLL